MEEDLRYMLQPSRIYVGESINVFQRGQLVMAITVKHKRASHTVHTTQVP